MASEYKTFISVIYAVTGTGCAAFSKSLCVPYMQVWFAEFCGSCPSLDYPSVPELRSWLNKPAALIFFQRQIFKSSRFLKHLEKTRKPMTQESGVLNLKGALDKIYLLQTIHLCSLYDIYTGKAAVLWCPPAAVLQGILHIPPYLYSAHPHYTLFLALLNTLQDANPFHLRVQILSIPGT